MQQPKYQKLKWVTTTNWQAKRHKKYIVFRNNSSSDTLQVIWINKKEIRHGKLIKKAQEVLDQKHFETALIAGYVK